MPLDSDDKVITHAQFVEEIDAYRKAYDFNKGKIEVMGENYLHQLDIEEKEYVIVVDDSGKEIRYKNNFGKKQWRRRLEQLDYFNHTSSILNIHIANLSSQLISIEEPTDSLQVVIDDATGYEVSLPDFIKECTRSYLLYGKVGILVDSERLVDEFSRPYLIRYDAPTILNWEMFKRGPNKGKFKLVTLAEEPIDGLNIVRDIYINEDGLYAWNLYRQKENDNEKFELIEEGIGELDYIPFKVIGRGYDDSAVKDVIPVSENRMNKKSGYDNILYNQSFQRSVLFSEAANKDVITFAEGVIAYSNDPQGRFETIEPVDPSALREEIMSLDRLAYRTGLFENKQLAADTRQVQSAESKAKDTDVLVEYYETLIQLLTKNFNVILDYVKDFINEDSETTITITSDFNLNDSQVEATQRQIAFNQARSLGLDNVAKEILKQSINKVFNNEQEVNQISEMIDSSTSSVVNTNVL